MKLKTYLNDEQFVAGMTLRDENFNEGNNLALHTSSSVEDVINNRHHLARKLNCEISNFVCANQTHSSNFYKVRKEDRGRGATNLETAIQNCDGLYSFERNLLLCSFTADCVPIIFYSKKGHVHGVIHSGWQGTVKEIIFKVFQHLANKENCQMDDIYVHIGAALSANRFEVDEDVYQQFKKLPYSDEYIYYNEKTNKYHIDNQKIVKKQCELANINVNNIRIEEICTFENDEYFSYRQNKSRGRHLSFIMRK